MVDILPALVSKKLLRPFEQCGNRLVGRAEQAVTSFEESIAALTRAVYD